MERSIMHHFNYLSDTHRDRLFYREPQPFGAESDPTLLAATLGATLYTPATRPTLAADISKQAAHGAMSIVACLEDAVTDEHLANLRPNLVNQLRDLGQEAIDGPLLFVRVRAPEQIPTLIDRLDDAAHVVTGFVLPSSARRPVRGFSNRSLRPASQRAVGCGRCQSSKPLR
ncbi:MAG TPA: HpcH/HpaI aldolase/citrate lyase family protein [Mycobacterium sp.]|nr:HpcH/HpaI aldolase/citrate lyase family protein [Mycobacterium sp.]